MFKYITAILIISIAFIACDNNSIDSAKIKKSEFKEPLIRVNKHLVDKDIDRIKNFAKRRNWNIKEAGTGYYYDIYNLTEQDSVKKGEIVSFNYKLSLLDGTLCYTSDSLGAKTIAVGQGTVESGLEQGLLLMKHGEKARFIIPPHLAHGILGDEKRIPGRSIIVYQIELLDSIDYNRN